MTTPKPHVQLACICEKALLEPDNVMSLIRVVDTYTLEPPSLGITLPAEIEMGLAVPLKIIVSLKSGDVRGEHPVGLQLVKPDHTVASIHEWTVMFNGDEHGVNLNIGFALRTPQYGLNWFEVLFDGEMLTRIPLRLKLKTAESADATLEPTQTVTHQ